MPRRRSARCSPTRRFTACGRNAGALVALDPETGKEIWVHDGLNGITSKGINYWESDNGKDRRLIFAVDSFLQEIDAKTGKSIHDLRR